MPESRTADRWRPAVLTAAISSLVCVLLALLLVQGSGLADSFTAALRSAVRAWLVSVGATYSTGGDRLSLVPIGATLVTVTVVFVVTRLVLRSPVGDPLAFGAMTGGVAGVLAGICSAASTTDAHGTSFVRATFGAFVVVGLPAAWGAARRAEVAWLGLPTRWTPLASGASTGVIGVLGGATVATLLMLVTRLEVAADLWASLEPDGPVLIGLLCLLAFPTLVLWTTSVILGPGFTIGPEAGVDLTGSTLGAVPGFPPLAALPDPGPFPGVVVLLTLIPLAAGIATGVVTYARSPKERREWGPAAADAALAGAVAGLVVGLLVETSRGSAGPGLLQQTGPAPWQSLLVAVPVMAAGAALGAIAAHYRSDRARSAS